MASMPNETASSSTTIKPIDGFVSQAAKERFESCFWTKSYGPGVQPNIGPLQCETVLEYIQDCLKKYKDRVAFVSAKVEMTYGDLDKKSDQFASYLQSVGVKSGDRVAIMLPNVLQFPVCLIGAMKAGAVVSNVNPLYTVRELQHQLKDTGAETIIVFASFASTLEKALEGTAVKNIVVTSFGDLFSDGLNLKGNLVNFVMKNIKKMVPEYNLPQSIGMRQAMSIGAKNSYTPVKRGLQDICLLQYTGGTTGVSKGAMLTNYNLLSNLQQGLSFIMPAIGKGDHTILTLLPMYHIYALAVNCMAFMSLGARNVIIANPRDIGMVMKVIRNEKISMLTAVNTLFNSFLNNEEFCKRDFSDLKFAMSGGMALQQAIAEKWYQVTKVPIVEGFGMSETSPVLSVPPLHGVEMPVFRGNVGLPVPGTEIRLRRDDGLWADINEPGEICARGPQIMKGYWQRQEETDKMIDAQGWLATGDIGVMNENGFLKIVDRKKDMIIVSGFNVYPNEIEDVVAMHPGVLEVGAIGLPDEITGEKIKLCVVKRTPDVTAEEIMAHCRKNLTGYKIPKVIEFWDELPKTNVGKILRRELRQKKPA